MRMALGVTAVVLSAGLLMGQGCGDAPRAERRTKPKASSGAVRQTVKIKTDAEGRTVEQRNVGRRLTMDNEPGSIKHIYIVSTQSGQTLLYSTVKSKVTSGGKSLAPKRVAAGYVALSQYQGSARASGYGPEVQIGNKVYRTPEVMGDDGTYGSSGGPVLPGVRDWRNDAADLVTSAPGSGHRHESGDFGRDRATGCAQEAGDEVAEGESHV